MQPTQERDALSPTKRAILELRELRARVAELEGAARHPVAVIGLGSRLPGASGPDAYWQLLRDGVLGRSPSLHTKVIRDPAEPWLNPIVWFRCFPEAGLCQTLPRLGRA